MSDPASITASIIAWRRLDNRITTSGQPKPAEIIALAQLGVRHVINLGMYSHEDALPDEARYVAQSGMQYTHIPVVFQNPTTQDFDQFCEALKGTGTEAVHVHCIFNWRVSAFMFKYRRDRLGVDAATARRDMDAIWQPDEVWATFLAEPRLDRSGPI